jgi:hypothetical protein
MVDYPKLISDIIKSLKSEQETSNSIAKDHAIAAVTGGTERRKDEEQQCREWNARSIAFERSVEIISSLANHSRF